MPTCVYCRIAYQDRFPREHVIPVSFGSFEDGLTLGCVCGDCNNYFSKHLELQFARESAESVARLRHDLRDNESAARTRRLTARVNVPGPILGAKVLLYPNATKDGIEIIYMPQVAFKNNNEEEWKWYTFEDLNSDLVRSLEPGSEVKYFITSSTEEEWLRSRLQELGLGNTKSIKRYQIPPQPNLKTSVTSIFDFNMARCVVKIAFNYLAYVLEENTHLLLRDDFDVVRNHVRQGLNSQQPLLRFSSAPRLEEDNVNRSFVDGHILAVDWDAAKGSIVCGLSFFNVMTYQVVLCPSYSGLWFPLQSAHCFDLQTKKARKIAVSLLT